MKGVLLTTKSQDEQSPSPYIHILISLHLGVWNKLDFLIYLIALVGFILKNISSTFQVARTLFAINAALLYIRLFRVYHASLQLGPKLVIFHRMIPEIITFMLLLIIFILGYGTASQEDLRKMSVWSLNFYQVIHNFSGRTPPKITIFS